MSKFIVFINDNNNFALPIFWSLYEFVSDCFGPKQSPPISYHDLKKKMVRSYFCLSGASFFFFFGDAVTGLLRFSILFYIYNNLEGLPPSCGRISIPFGSVHLGSVVSDGSLLVHVKTTLSPKLLVTAVEDGVNTKPSVNQDKIGKKRFD